MEKNVLWERLRGIHLEMMFPNKDYLFQLWVLHDLLVLLY